MDVHTPVLVVLTAPPLGTARTRSQFGDWPHSAQHQCCKLCIQQVKFNSRCLIHLSFPGASRTALHPHICRGRRSIHRTRKVPWFDRSASAVTQRLGMTCSTATAARHQPTLNPAFMHALLLTVAAI